MNRVLKTTLRVALLLALIWVLAALTGVVQGATLQIGNSGKRGRRGCRGRAGYRWTNTGMQASRVVTPGVDNSIRAGVPRVGVGWSV